MTISVVDARVQFYTCCIRNTKKKKKRESMCRQRVLLLLFQKDDMSLTQDREKKLYFN